MKSDAISAMISQAVEVLSLGKDEGIRSLVRDLVNRWPEEPALSISFVLANAAAEVADNFENRATEIGYRLSSLVAADVYALQAMGHTSPCARDLLHFWRRVDPFFLSL